MLEPNYQTTSVSNGKREMKTGEEGEEEVDIAHINKFISSTH